MRFFSLASRNMKEIYRDPVSMTLGIGLPCAMLLLFVSIGRRVPIDTFSVQALTPGVIVFSYAFLMMFAAILLAKDRQSAFLTRLLTTPLTTTDFILAYSVPFLPIALLQTVAAFFVGLLLGLELSMGILLSLVVLIPMAVTTIGIGLLFGSLLTENQVSGVGSIVIVIASIFSGAWMDLQMLGGVLALLAYAMPFAHTVDAARAIVRGAQFGEYAVHFFLVVAYAVLFLVLGALAFRLKTRR